MRVVSPAWRAVQLPARYGKYVLLERLSVGGMGEIFLAKMLGPAGFQQTVALKRILPHMAEEDSFVSMFIDEAKISARLSHPGICQVYDFGRVGDTYFLAMEYVAGRDLRRIQKRFARAHRPAPIPLVTYVFSKVCEALEYAHRLSDCEGRPIGLVHRDVSPQNIIVSYLGNVKIIDFGIAKAAMRLSSTGSGGLKGKYSYMSMEQASGSSDIDRRSDIFTLGTVVHELLTGRRLFARDNEIATIEAVRTGNVVPPSQLNPDVPADLDRIVLKALAPDRERRYQWAAELQEDLEQFASRRGQKVSMRDMGAFMIRFFAREYEQEQQKARDYEKIRPEDVSEQDPWNDSHSAGHPQLSADSGSQPLAFDSLADTPVARPSELAGPSGSWPLPEVFAIGSDPSRAMVLAPRTTVSGATGVASTLPAPPRRPRALVAAGILGGALLLAAIAAGFWLSRTPAGDRPGVVMVGGSTEAAGTVSAGVDEASGRGREATSGLPKLPPSTAATTAAGATGGHGGSATIADAAAAARMAAPADGMTSLSLLVSSSPSGAQVEVLHDGQVVQRLSSPTPVRVGGLRPGARYWLRLRLPGFDPASQEVSLASGSDGYVHLRLPPAADGGGGIGRLAAQTTNTPARPRVAGGRARADSGRVAHEGEGEKTPARPAQPGAADLVPVRPDEI